jgi:hypothetical protein
MWQWFYDMDEEWPDQYESSEFEKAITVDANQSNVPKI